MEDHERAFKIPRRSKGKYVGGQCNFARTFLIENYGVGLSTDRENTESVGELVMIFNY